MNEMDLEDYKHGGINVTGFRLIDFASQHAKSFLTDWSAEDPESWPGAGRNKISVSREFDGLTHNDIQCRTII